MTVKNGFQKNYFYHGNLPNNGMSNQHKNNNLEDLSGVCYM